MKRVECSYFRAGEQADYTKKLDASALQKVVAELRIYYYGILDNACGEPLGISTRTSLISLKGFCSSAMRCLEPQYFQGWSTEDLEKIKKLFEWIGSSECLDAWTLLVGFCRDGQRHCTA